MQPHRVLPGHQHRAGSSASAGSFAGARDVNPDLFSIIVDTYDLRSRFDAIVTSWEIGTTDKVAICQAACDEIGCSPQDSALIDNIASNVEGWIEAGGGGYVFRSDGQFIQDVEAGSFEASKRPTLLATDCGAVAWVLTNHGGSAGFGLRAGLGRLSQNTRPGTCGVHLASRAAKVPKGVTLPAFEGTPSRPRD